MNLLTRLVAIFLERSPAGLPLEDLHMLGSPFPSCTIQLFLRLLDTLRSSLPLFFRRACSGGAAVAAHLLRQFARSAGLDFLAPPFRRCLKT